MEFLEHVALAQYTTFGIGGPARWFAVARCEADVLAAVRWADAHGAPLFVLGGGSNLLVSDAGFDGLVLKMELTGVAMREDGTDCLFEAGAGENWERFVERTVEANCAGVECLAGIPGTVGGTPVQNVGAYGQEAGQTIVRVRALDRQTLEFVEFTAAECGFAYRHSRFNSEDRDRYIVTRVDFRLRRNGAASIRYADLERALEGVAAPTLKQVAEAVCKVRESKGMRTVPNDADSQSAGSFFKNPVVEQAVAERIAAAAGKAPASYPAGEGRVKLAAAWLIEQAGFGKGYTLGRAGLSTCHTLALTNRGDATATEVAELAERIRGEVKRRFGVELQMEPVRLGFD